MKEATLDPEPVAAKVEDTVIEVKEATPQPESVAAKRQKNKKREKRSRRRLTRASISNGHRRANPHVTKKKRARSYDNYCSRHGLNKSSRVVASFTSDSTSYTHRGRAVKVADDLHRKLIIRSRGQQKRTRAVSCSKSDACTTTQSRTTC